MKEIVITTPAILHFLSYFGTAAGITAFFFLIYTAATPYKETALIAAGNTAAACSLTGTLIGFAIPLASVIAHSVSLLDMAVWGAVALLVQLFTFLVVRLAFPSVPRAIPQGQTSSGILLGGISIAAGILNAACMTP